MYICRASNKASNQKHDKMKIQAKDLKVGQDVKFGNNWIKIENLIEGTQKNGKGFVQVCGTVYEGKIRSSYGNRKVEAHYSDYNCPKIETLVTVR
tara:strand:- start:350 stop:634 length:285 start_codon:yes stop_codon:yes gene_type:complete